MMISTQRLVWVCPQARPAMSAIRQLYISRKTRLMHTACTNLMHTTSSHSSCSCKRTSLLSVIDDVNPRCVMKTFLGTKMPVGVLPRYYGTTTIPSGLLLTGSLGQNRVFCHKGHGSKCSSGSLLEASTGCGIITSSHGLSVVNGRSFCSAADQNKKGGPNGKLSAESADDEAYQGTTGASTDDKNDELEAKLQEARDYMDMMREKGTEVPESISDENLEYFAQLSKRKRGGYLKHLFRKEMKKRRKAEVKKKEQEMRGEFELRTHQTWNAFLRRIGKKDFEALAGWRLSSAIKFNPQIVFDCVYEEMMKWQDVRSLATQFATLYSDNYMAHQPFHIKFVNFNYDGLIARELKKMYGDPLEDKLMVDLNTKGLLDIYPRSELVYLSPDSDKVFTAYDPNKVYVIGALVDKNTHEVGASLSQAKQLGIAHCRLPLDAYFHWSEGAHKSMTLDSMANIFIGLNTHGDMGKALEKCIPQRKQGGFRFDISDKSVQNVLLKTIGGDQESGNKMRPRNEKSTLKKNPSKSGYYESGDASPFSYSRARQRRQDRGGKLKFDPEWQTGSKTSQNENRRSTFNPGFDNDEVRQHGRPSQAASRYPKRPKKWTIDNE